MAFFRTGGGTDTSDANATAADILLNKTAYVNDIKITGSMPNNGDVSHTIGAGEVYNVPAGYTSGGVITAIAAGATITVSYTSQFYNKTITCSKGQTVYTQTTTSSGSTTFSVAEGGTWTITCNGVSRQVDVVLEYTTQMAITATVDVYSAASDTVSFTDITGAKTVTTNTSGQGSVTISFIPNSTITFTSSKAKNPTNLSQTYSKTITMTDSITSVYVMPDGVIIYWFGFINYAFSNDFRSATYHGSVTYNTNNLVINTWHSGNWGGRIWQDLYTTDEFDLSGYNTLKGICASVYSNMYNVDTGGNNAAAIGIWHDVETLDPYTNLKINSENPSLLSVDISNASSGHPSITGTINYTNVNNNMYCWALWLE